MAVSIPRKDVPDVIDNMKALGQNEVTVDGKGTKLEVDLSLDVEFQTDKQAVKLVPCRECKRPLVVTTFFAPAKAICAADSGRAAAEGDGRGTVGQPVPGQTDPRKAVDLTQTLINPTFAQARCPVHPDDDEHEMLLVSVSHHEHYGPQMFLRYEGGKPVYKQIAPGETVVLQCQHENCLATVTYSTTPQQRILPMNAKKAPDLGRRPGFTLELLNGTKREERPATAGVAA